MLACRTRWICSTVDALDFASVDYLGVRTECTVLNSFNKKNRGRGGMLRDLLRLRRMRSVC